MNKLTKPRYRYQAFTDGSCPPLSPYGEGGSAYILFDDGVEIKRASKGFIGTTNNRMEQLAIISAVNSIPVGEGIDIYTDSRIAIHSFTKKTKHNTKNQDLILRYQKVAEGKKVCFHWVKGHSGITYNEECDMMAVAQMRKIQQENNIPTFNRFNSPKVRKKQLL